MDAGVYRGGGLVLVDMALTTLAIVLNLCLVLAIRRTGDLMRDIQSILQLNLVLNNLLVCVLVKSFEVVFVGLAVALDQTR